MYRRNRPHHDFVSEQGVLVGMNDQNILLLVGVAAILALALYLINPPASQANKHTPTAPLSFYMQLQWPDNEPHDIDTYARCITRSPGSNVVHVVWFSQVQDGWLTLDRDDQGGPSPLNLERVQANSDVMEVPPNTECRINAHLFHSHGGKLPVKARLVVIVHKDSMELQRTVADVSFELSSAGEEISLFDALWDETGEIERDSVETYPDLALVKIATK